MKFEFDNVLVVIPCRKGSKRLPHKNMSSVGGIPLVQRTIQIAKEAGLNHSFPPYLKSQIIVSSDDVVEVKNIALVENVEFLNRPEKLATDEAQSEDVILHVIEHIDTIFHSNKFDTVCLLQVTSPLLRPGSLKKALKIFYKDELTSLVAVNELTYKPCGAFYIAKIKEFAKQGTFWMDDMAIYLLGVEESIDVDYPWDWSIASALEFGRVY